jgi:asparagine synthetase B (glutamine-hydrolysing)
LFVFSVSQLVAGCRYKQHTKFFDVSRVNENLIFFKTIAMCGIFGLLLGSDAEYPLGLLKGTIDHSFMLSESRGKEAAGLAVFRSGRLDLYKEPVRASLLIHSKKYNKLMQEISGNKYNRMSKEPLTAIGHTRLATNGPVAENNNCPIVAGDIAGVHNGIIVNDEIIWKHFRLLERKGSVDSEVIFSLLNFFSKEMPLTEATQAVYEYLEGSASIAAFILSRKQVVLATNTGSVYFCKNRQRNMCIFCSELPMLQVLIKKSKLYRAIGQYDIFQLKPMQGCLIDMDTLVTQEFNLNHRSFFAVDLNKARIYSSAQVLNRSTYPAEEAMKRIKRCTRCILPSTMPLIQFDEQGVCNYCGNYKKIQVNGEEALENLVAAYRSKSGSPDCVVAFSGGRDSSYGLHYVKKVLKMNPIAFTYDWGMVADIGRRNQSRLVSRLGVEHIIKAADIQLRRKYIRQNIAAWLRRPHLGMIPLFMAGDKPVEYYVTEAAKKYNIKLIFLFRGNELETTEYKFGFLGVKNSEPGGVMHEMPIISKTRLALAASWQYILNPAYFNSSLLDILFAYYVTCMMPLNFVYLWHYVKWEEDKIVTTLKKEYDWETEKDTILTWRTDDGTAPFYNYIYCTVAGFTENDAFRSNQIREGVLTRQRALRIIEEENRPRYEAIKEYLNKLELDYTEIMQKIEAIPKLY